MLGLFLIIAVTAIAMNQFSQLVEAKALSEQLWGIVQRQAIC
jgi:hypothetical protein